MLRRNLEGWGPSWGVMDAPLTLSLPHTHHPSCWWTLCLSVRLITHLLGLSACLCRETMEVPLSFPCIAGVLWS